MRTPASFAIGRTLLARVGVSPSQYQLLVDLFETLGERKELFGNLGMDRHAMRLTTLALVLPGGLLALTAFGSSSLASYNMAVLALSSLVLVLLLVMEASNSFFNPAEVAVLAHRPIAGSTYFAAKLTYLFLVVLRAEAALNGPAALAGLIKPDAQWFYPITHMAAACTLGLFLALACCALFGLLFRIVPPSKLRSAVLWLHLVVVTAPLLANLAWPLRRSLTTALPNASSLDWSFIPLLWFNALATVGQGGPVVAIGWSAVAGMAVSAAFVVYGVRALSAGYMTRIVGAMRSAGGRRKRRRRSVGAKLVRVLTGRPSGQAAYDFVLRMMRRDWQFRRAAMQSVLFLLVAGPAVVLSGRATSPFDADSRMPLIGLLPELLPFLTFGICSLLAYSDHHRAAWIFGGMTDDARRNFVRGVYWSLWLPFVATPFVACAVFFSWHWGAFDATLFAAYGLAVASCLFGLQVLLIEGLPFGSPPKPERPFTLLPLILFGPVVIGVAWFVQGRFIFHSRLTTAVAAVLFAVCAVLVGQFALRMLYVKIHRDIERQSGGAVEMFGHVAE